MLRPFRLSYRTPRPRWAPAAGVSAGGLSGRAWALLLWLTALSLTHPANAEEASAIAAQALFEQGRALMAEGKTEAACQKFDASQRLEAGLGTLLYLGDCYEGADRLASAFGAFTQAAKLAEERGDIQRADLARVRAAALQPRLIRLVVNPPPEVPPGLEIRANGRVLESADWGKGVPVDSGKWVVQVSAPGYVGQQFEVLVLAAATEPYKLYITPLVPVQSPVDAAPAAEAGPSAAQAAEPGTTLAPSTVVAPSPRDDSATGSSGQATVAYVVGGLGVASAIASGVLSYLAILDNRDSNRGGHCDGSDCDAEGKSLRDDARRLANVATVFGVIGGVGVASGLTLYLTAPSPDSATARVEWTTTW